MQLHVNHVHRALGYVIAMALPHLHYKEDSKYAVQRLDIPLSLSHSAVDQKEEAHGMHSKPQKTKVHSH